MTPSTSLPVIVVVFMRLCIDIVNGELIERPQDAYALAKNSTYFNCSTANRQNYIHWYHYRVGENKTNYVYYKGEINKIYGSRYTIETNAENGTYHLHIASVEPQDAGLYVCQDNGGLGSAASAQLIVLNASPTCNSNMSSGAIMGPNSCGIQTENLQLSCSLSYHGNIPPLMEWVKVNESGVLLENRTTVDSRGNRVTVNLTLKADASMDRSDFLCRTKRTRSTKHECTTGPVKVNYAFGSTSVINVTMDDEVNCSANTNQLCQYRWFYGNDSFCPEACDRNLKSSKIGIHRCQASCSINGYDCIFSARTIQVFEKTAADTTDTIVTVTNSTAVIVLLVIVIGLILVIAIMAAIVCAKRRRKARRKPVDEQEIALSPMLSTQQPRSSVDNDASENQPKTRRKPVDEQETAHSPMLPKPQQMSSVDIDASANRPNKSASQEEKNSEQGKAQKQAEKITIDKPASVAKENSEQRKESTPTKNIKTAKPTAAASRSSEQDDTLKPRWK